MQLIYCDKCHRWFDIDSEYYEIIRSKKTDEYTEKLIFCQKCGENVFNTIDEMLIERVVEL